MNPRPDPNGIDDEFNDGGAAIQSTTPRPVTGSKRDITDLSKSNEIFEETSGEGFLGLEPGIDPRETFGGDPGYNQAVYRGLLLVSDYQKVLVRAIERAQLFKETKDSLITIVAGLFDKTEVLAKTQSVWLEYIDVEIILAQARIGFVPFDVDNPQLSTIINMILKHYRQFASRSAQGWERGLQNRIETSHTAVYQQGGGRPMQPPQGGKGGEWG